LLVISKLACFACCFTLCICAFNVMSNIVAQRSHTPSAARVPPTGAQPQGTAGAAAPPTAHVATADPALPGGMRRCVSNQSMRPPRRRLARFGALAARRRPESAATLSDVALAVSAVHARRNAYLLTY